MTANLTDAQATAPKRVGADPITIRSLTDHRPDVVGEKIDSFREDLGIPHDDDTTFDDGTGYVND